MADHVESAFFARTPAWHNIGTVVEKEVTSSDAIVLAGLDWDVGVKTVSAEVDEGLFVDIPDVKAVVRLSDNTPLGVVGNRYAPVQNRNAFSFFDSVVGEGKAIYHAAGSLFGGRKIWILAKLPGEIVVGKGDVTHKYLLLSNTHDGSGTLRMLLTPVRVVCANTLAIALHGARGQGISIRHTNSVETRMRAAELSVKAATEFYDAFNEQAMLLASKQYSRDQLNEMLLKLFPNPENVDRETTANAIKRDRVIQLFENGAGHDKIAGSAWAAIQAVSEFAQWEMKTNQATQEKSVDSLWFGKVAGLNQLAWDTVMQQIAS